MRGRIVLIMLAAAGGIGAAILPGVWAGSRTAPQTRPVAQTAPATQPAAAPQTAPATQPAASQTAPVPEPDTEESPDAQAARLEARLLTRIRQVTFAGRRSGEGYFHPDGTRLVFQSERTPENPFYQIYTLDLTTGETVRVSPGAGKATCAWYTPDGDRVLFASTHADPEAQAKQEAEIEFRASGEERRYAWDYDEWYDLYLSRADGPGLRNLTRTRGYDAEGSMSPDGEWIVFASNRRAYAQELSPEEEETLARDPAYFVDLYRMRRDGGGLQRLTDAPGYDGGPFFSPDGSRICWRRFSEDGATAEIFTMAADGADQRALTRLGAMSWAPFYHPSGDYLIFATNRHGFANFELYLVDAAGAGDPVRVTHTDGFDGLPVFAPDGRTLAWTSTRVTGRSQIFFAGWNDAAARRRLGLPPAAVSPPDPAHATAAITPGDIRTHVAYLAADALEGRRAGSPGERRATAYVAEVFEALGLLPAGENGSYFQEFEFTAGVSLGPGNLLEARGPDDGSLGPYAVDADWRPLAFSSTGEVPAAGVVFAGYGIVAPATEGHAEYDSYVHLDVRDRWVLVFRYLPEGITPEHRQHLARHASLRYKAMVARDRGAKGLIVVSGPNSQVKAPLVRLAFDASLADTSIAALSITDALAGRWLASAGKTLPELQDALDTGEPMMGLALPDLSVAATVHILQEKAVGRNVLARLPAGRRAGETAVLLGAHVDHLGRGETTGSLARDEEKGLVHAGADDNASGVAGLLEIAQALAARKRQGMLTLRRDLLFAAWSGEEVGLLGSSHFARAFGGGPEPATLTPALAAYLNMDMIGRLDGALVLQGVGSSTHWPGLIEAANAPLGLAVVTQDESYLPTDATAFYLKRVPILNAFTGAHAEYHTPRDLPVTLNYAGAARVARLMARVAAALGERAAVPDYLEMEKPEQGEQRAGLRAYLGTIPDYSQGDMTGVKLSGVAQGGPAARAGVRGGDVIVGLAGRTVENIYDYTYAIDALKIGAPVEIIVLRSGERLTLTVTPDSRE